MVDSRGDRHSQDERFGSESQWQGLETRTQWQIVLMPFGTGGAVIPNNVNPCAAPGEHRGTTAAQ